MRAQNARSPPTNGIYSTYKSRWSATIQRARSAHSSFLYGVKSTRIYCRPTCTARLARRANVVFFDTEEQAKSDGFRPCKRCKPDDQSFVGEAEETVVKVLSLLRSKEGNPAMSGGLRELADKLGITTSYLCRIFKKKMGVTIGAYVKEFEASETIPDSSVRFLNKGLTEKMVLRAGSITEGITTTTIPEPAEELNRTSTGMALDTEDSAYLSDLEFNIDDWVCADRYPGHDTLG